MINTLHDVSSQLAVTIHQGESFKQAMYNGRLTDTENQLRGNIELAAKHYHGTDLIISIYESDEESRTQFAYAVVMPALA